MEKSLKLFLSLILLSFFSCDTEYLSKEEREKKAASKWQNFLDNDGYSLQGTPVNMKAVEEVLQLDPQFSDAWRELSAPYIKRGMPQEWKKYMDKAVISDSIRWRGWRGYLYLYFYRDYQKAIADFNATDSLTPDFIDAPQGHSVDYWRGHAYLGAKNYKKSIYYYQKHIAYVKQEFGEDWVEPDAFLNLAIAHYENKAFDSMPYYLDKALHYYQDKSADTKYYYALYHKNNGDSIKAMSYLESGIEDFLGGYYKRRNFNKKSGRSM